MLRLLALSTLCVLAILPAPSAALAAQANADRFQVNHDIHIQPEDQVGDVTCINCSVYVLGRVSGDVTSGFAEHPVDVATDVLTLSPSVSPSRVSDNSASILTYFFVNRPHPFKGSRQFALQPVRKLPAQNLARQLLGYLPSVFRRGQPFTGPAHHQPRHMLGGAQQLGGMVECAGVVLVE